jgi:hypothetical protein
VHWFFTQDIEAQPALFAHVMQMSVIGQSVNVLHARTVGQVPGVGVHTLAALQYFMIIVSAQVRSFGAHSVHASPQTLPTQGL